MKKAVKIIAVILAVCIVISGVVVGVLKKGEINYFFSAMNNAVVAIQDGSWKDAGKTSSNEETELASFVSGKYGGIDFKTEKDVVDYYVQAYNKTKEKTAQYIDDQGQEQTYYAMLGTEDIVINKVLVEGSENSIISNLVPSIVSGLFNKNLYGLPPCTNRDPKLDVDANSQSFIASRLTAEDIKACSVKDNGDGTITLTLVPIDVEMSHRGQDAQGKMFNTLGAIDKTVDSITVLSWASGTTQDNCKVLYADGTAVVKIDTASGEIVEADYKMNVEVSVSHANVTVLKDKSAVLNLSYVQHFPADEKYMMDTKGVKKAS